MGRHAKQDTSGLTNFVRPRRRSVQESSHSSASEVAIQDSPVKTPARPLVRKSEKWRSIRVTAFMGRARMIFSAAFFVAVGVTFVNVIDPYSGATASPYFQPMTYAASPAQELRVGSIEAELLGRDGITLGVAAAIAAATAPFVGVPDPNTAQAIAYELVRSRGWGQDQFNCLVALWNRESRWRVNASNASSGAYGIPQALPGSKMAAAGSDWQTNPATQIAWGLGYIQGRYGSPCGAWAHSEAKGWY